jgi:hypothetical protein
MEKAFLNEGVFPPAGDLHFNPALADSNQDHTGAAM